MNFNFFEARHVFLNALLHRQKPIDQTGRLRMSASRAYAARRRQSMSALCAAQAGRVRF